MITAIEIENFKGIHGRTRIEFAPITLLFGNNGAGKSTVAHALMLFDQVFREHDLSLDGLQLTGNAVRLGGGNRCCHNHESKSIRIRLELTANDSITSSTSDKKNWIELSIRASLPTRLPFPILNLCSPAVVESIGFGEGTDHNVTFSSFAGKTRIEISFSEFRAKEIGIEQTNWILEHESAGSLLSSLGRIPTTARLAGSEIENLAVIFSHDLVTNIRNSVDDILLTHRHIGPMRARPGVNFIALPPSQIEPHLWYDGSAAWHFFCHTHDDNQIWINQWLGPEYLDTGIELRSRPLIDQRKMLASLDNAGIKSHEEIPNTIFREAIMLSRSDLCQIEAKILRGKDIASEDAPSLSICDLGFGVSQIVPIVVACIIRRDALISIEEPESHVHPRLQSRLGDLLIDSTSNKVKYGDPNQLLVETHSEHLILRLQRRIRETTTGIAPESLRLDSDDVAVNYIGIAEGVSYSRRIDIDQHGDFVQPWPDDFFDLDIKERFGDAR